jgi:hypothetical protein
VALRVVVAVASKAYKKEESDYIALQCMSLISIKK